MKNKLIYGFIILLLGCVNEIEEGFNEICTSSCVVINGRFTTEDGTVGIANLPLELDWSIMGMLNGAHRKIATGETDANGYYSFSFSPRDEELTKGDFSIEFALREGHLIDERFAYFDLPITSRDTALVRNYHIPSKARIKLVVSNLTDIAKPDYLSSTVLYEKDDFDKDIRVVSGMIDTRYNPRQSITLSTAGNQYTYIKSTISKDGTIEIYLDSLVVPTNQEVTYELKF
jgi:hypothetical protein